MTAINTNTAALNAQYYLAKSNKDMESSMAKLSSGQKVNSAADDAAGLAIASRMTAQIRGLAMAVKNSNDSMSLAQTAEGAMEEVTNMLQRIRELAVQSSNGTMNTSDRASLDAEVQALKSEIDRVATTTTFNSQNLLDGSYKATFQIGDKGGQTVGLKIGSVLTSSLGMGSGAAGANSLVSSRVAFAAVDAGDIEINGQALGAIASTDHMEDVVKNINDNVDNVVASGFNVVVAENVGNGVTNGDGASGGAGATTTTGTGMVIKVREQGVTADTTFTISASSNMEELVANINVETGGVVVAATNDDGKLVLSNNTGATITVEDDSTSGSGFGQAVSTFTGFLKLDALDDEPIRVTKGNKGLAAFGSDTDLSRIGFRETKATTLEDGYTILGSAPSSPEAALEQGDLFINGVEIFDEGITVDSFSDKLALINSKSAETGVTASAFFEKTFTITDSDLTLDTFELNGTDITLTAATVSDLVSKINAQTANTGVEAEANGNNVTLRGENVQSVTIGYKSEAELEDGFNAATTTTVAAGATDVADVDIVLNAADVVIGRTYKLETDSKAGGFTDINVTYTAVTGDDANAVMEGLRDALIAFSDEFVVGGASNNIDTSTAGTLTFTGSAEYGKADFTFGIDSSAIKQHFGSGNSGVHDARLKLDSVDNSPIKINLGQNTTASEHAERHGLIESGVGAADFDVNEPTLSAAGGSSMSGLTISSAASATKALGTIDNAIDTVNTIRGDLGALQNRLEYTINNLSSISNATAGARGRILDADFAKTTSELTKHQILTQAATSMLAQANQSKQGILALLQG